MFTGIPEPFASILSALVGPFGVVVLEGVVIYFLWKLFRESTTEARRAQDNVSALTQTVKDLVSESRTFRETLLARLGD